MKKQILCILFAFCSMIATAQVANTAPSLIGAWSGKLKLGAASLTLVFHFEQADGYMICSLDSPDQGAKGIGAYKHFLSEDSVSLSITAIGADFQAYRKGDKLLGTFSQRGMNFPLTLTKGDYTPKRTQTPSFPLPYITEEVSFTNTSDQTTLVGTLTYPSGYNHEKNVPIVLMVTGSGLQNRDEEIFDHKPFFVIADHFARHGIATLRYDDRGCGASSTGSLPINKATTPDFMRDAEAGIQYLHHLNKFGAIGVLGHSEGGNIAFMLGSHEWVDFIVSMAGVGVKGDTALTAQANCIMHLQGQKTSISTHQYRQNIQALGNAWTSWFIDHDPSTDLAAINCPTLAINGDKDCQVIADLNLNGIKRVLPQNQLSLIKKYPSLNHLFQHCQTGLPDEYNRIEETISIEVLKDMTEWINKVYTAKRGQAAK